MKLFQGPVKYVIGYWARLGTTLAYTKAKNVRVTIEFEAPKRHILRPTLSTDMVQRVLWWRRKSGARVEKGKGPWQRNVVLINSQWFIFEGEERMKTKEDKSMVKLDFRFPKLPFWDIYSKIITFTFWCMVIPLCPIWFTPSERPKSFVKCFLKEIGPWSLTMKSDHGQRPSFMVRLHGPWCKPTPAYVLVGHDDRCT